MDLHRDRQAACSHPIGRAVTASHSGGSHLLERRLIAARVQPLRGSPGAAGAPHAGRNCVHPLQVQARWVCESSSCCGRPLAIMERVQGISKVLLSPLVQCLLQNLHNGALSGGIAEGLPREAVHEAERPQAVLTTNKHLQSRHECGKQLTSSTECHSRPSSRLYGAVWPRLQHSMLFKPGSCQFGLLLRLPASKK